MEGKVFQKFAYAEMTDLNFWILSRIEFIILSW